LNKNSSTARGFNQAFNRVGDAYEELRKLVDESTAVSIYTHLRYYENMLLENLQTTDVITSRENNELHSVSFSVDCKQIRVVKTELAALSDFNLGEKKTGVNQAKPKKKKGKTGKDLLDRLTDPARKTSLLKTLVPSW